MQLEILKINPLDLRANDSLVSAIVATYITAFPEDGVGKDFQHEHHTPESVRQKLFSQVLPGDVDRGARIFVAVVNPEDIQSGELAEIDGRQVRVVGGQWDTGNVTFAENREFIVQTASESCKEPELVKTQINEELDKWKHKPDSREMVYIAEMWTILENTGVARELMNALIKDVGWFEYKTFSFWTNQHGKMAKLAEKRLGVNKILNLADDNALYEGNAFKTKLLFPINDILIRLKRNKPIRKVLRWLGL